MSERLFLKWGTLKGWAGVQKDSSLHLALQRYHEEPTALGAAQQRDTSSQKQALFEAIEAADEIINDWSDETMTKDEAKRYIEEYRA